MLILLIFQQSFQNSLQLEETELEPAKLIMNSVKYLRKICKNNACIKKPKIWNKYGLLIFSIIKVTHKLIYCFLGPHIFL